MHTYYQTVKSEVNTFWCFTYWYFVDDNSDMDMAPIRRQRLRYLIDTEYGGSQVAFIEKTGINQGELSGLLKRKSFGEKKARALEAAADLPNMYLDCIEPGQGKEPVIDAAGVPASGVDRTTPLTKQQKQVLSLMESLDKDTKDALLKIVAQLVKHQSAEKPHEDHGVIDEVKSVESGAGIIKTATYAGLNRRRKNLGRAPERRLDSKTYSDEHDLSDYVHNDNREEQIQKKGEIDD